MSGEHKIKGKLTITVDDAKLNPKYYLAKKFKPEKQRVRDADIANLRHYCEPEGITVSVLGNVITFAKTIEGESKSITFNGKDTGGQFLRLIVTFMINYGLGRTTDIKTIELPKFSRAMGKNGKAIMLMVQMSKMTLQVGRTAEYKYGDKRNSEARNFDDMPVLFDLLKDVFGINFTITEGEEDCFLLERHANTPRKEMGVLKIDNHLTDEILFTAISLWSSGEDIPDIEIETPISWDYHIGAMVKFGKGIGMRIEDSKPEEGVKEWVSSGGVRIVKIFNEK